MPGPSWRLFAQVKEFPTRDRDRRQIRNSFSTKLRFPGSFRSFFDRAGADLPSSHTIARIAAAKLEAGSSNQIGVESQCAHEYCEAKRNRGRLP